MMLSMAATLLSALGSLAAPGPGPAEQNPTPPDAVGSANAKRVGQWLTLPVSGLKLKVPKGPAERVEVSGLVDGTGPRLLAQDGLRFLDDGGRTPAMATVEVGVPDCDHLTKPTPWRHDSLAKSAQRLPASSSKDPWAREDRPVDNGRIAVILCKDGMNQEWLVPSAEAAKSFDEWWPWVDALEAAWRGRVIDAKGARALRADVFVQEATPTGPGPIGPPACAFGPAGYTAECPLLVPWLGVRLVLADAWYTNDSPADSKALAPPSQTTLRLAIPAAAQLTVVLRDAPAGSACAAGARQALPPARIPKGWRVVSNGTGGTNATGGTGAAGQPWRLCLDGGRRALTAEVTSALPAARVPETLWPLLGGIAAALRQE